MKIVIGITGSIAAYKSPDLVRRLKEMGHEIRVVMTKGGQAFVTPLTFQAVSGHPVVYDLLDPNHEAGMGHIELSRWADIILIAPASANTIAKLAHGFANDLLSAICLASSAPIVLAPGMNRLMWDNVAVQANLATLLSRGYDVMDPSIGKQACGETGKGRMPEPLDIRNYIQRHYGDAHHSKLAGKHIVITAGPTIEAIDPVRFISNYSSGKMGYALALSAKKNGAKVTLISGPVHLKAPIGVEVIHIKTAQELLSASLNAVNSADVFIAAAAVADYYVENPAQIKMKKKEDQDSMTLTLKKNPDILATISMLKENRPFCVGFAAETDNLITHAKEKRARKNLDLICLNDVAGGKVFNQNDNEIIMIDRNDQEYVIAQDLKANVANEIIRKIAELL